MLEIHLSYPCQSVPTSLSSHETHICVCVHIHEPSSTCLHVPFPTLWHEAVYPFDTYIYDAQSSSS